MIFLYIILAIQLIQFFVIALLFIESRRAREDIRAILLGTSEIHTHTQALRSSATDQAELHGMIVEANRFRAEHPELWKWEPEQPSEAKEE